MYIERSLCAVHTMDNRFQVNRQPIGFYFNTRAIVARDIGIRLTLFEA